MTLVRPALIALAAVIAAPAAAQAAPVNPAAGKLVFMRCAACHNAVKGQPNKIGPNLAGVVGRKSGTAPGFRYSAPFAKANLTWNEATLDKWLTRPAALVPGTSMVFAGLPNPQDRANVIAYLKKPVP
jgi:cytochrome c